MNMRRVTLMLAGMAALAGSAWGEPAGDAAGKAIIVEGTSGSAAAKQGLTVEIRSVKKSYDVDEAITFTAETNRPAYLYLFSVTPENRVIQVFPNKFETGNQVRAHEKITIPQKSKLKGDRAGREKFILIAGAAKLNVPSQDFGDRFYEVKQHEMEGLRKAITVEGPGSTAATAGVGRDRFYKEFEVEITGGKTSAEPVTVSGDRPLVLVTTDKYRYRLDEKATFGYAVDADGLVRIYQVTPDRKLTRITEQKVEKGKIYTWSGKAEAPVGDYALIAVFRKTMSEESTAGDEAFMKSLFIEPDQTKGLTRITPPEVFAIHRFAIE